MSAKTLFLFPGQGAQYPGIGSDLITEYHQAQAIYARASEILGYDLEKLCNDSKSGDINLTRYTQPVLLVHSFVCLQLFLKQCNNPPDLFATAGHSLGEYTALVAAGSLSFENALRLVAKRGECMGAQGGGEMLALSLSEEQVKPYLESSNCEIAALNLAEQTVIGGWPAELDQLAAAIDVDYPGKGGIRLKTEGAFHTSHMYPAAQTFKPILADTEILPPEVWLLLTQLVNFTHLKFSPFAITFIVSCSSRSGGEITLMELLKPALTESLNSAVGWVKATCQQTSVRTCKG